MGVTDVISTLWGGLTTGVSDVYHGVKTAVGDTAYGTEGLFAKTGNDIMTPVTGMITTFSYPVMAIGGGLALFIIYEMSQTSRASLPYLPQIIDSGGKYAPLLGAL